MKRGLIAAVAIGLAAMVTAGSPAIAGNGQGGGYNGQCQPGRPGCPRPPGNHYHQQYNDNYADNHGGPYNAYWYHRPYRLSCGAAEERLEDNGFHNVVAKDCSGKRYHFSATKGGRRVQVVMNSRTGNFWRR